MAGPNFSGWSATVLMCLLALAIVSGGLMVAPIMGLGGALVAPYVLTKHPLPSVKPYQLLGVAFVAWWRRPAFGPPTTTKKMS